MADMILKLENFFQFFPRGFAFLFAVVVPLLILPMTLGARVAERSGRWSSKSQTI